MKSLQSFDWRSLQRYLSPKVADDLNRFLEKLPARTNKTMIIIAGLSWGLAGLTGLYTTITLRKLTELRAELVEAQAVQPEVPVVRDVAVNSQQVKDFVDRIKDIYQGLTIKASGPSIVISAKSTAQFGQFREAVGHVQNGGAGWRVNVERLCVGRECERDPLAIALKISNISVEKPH